MTNSPETTKDDYIQAGLEKTLIMVKLHKGGALVDFALDDDVLVSDEEALAARARRLKVTDAMIESAVNEYQELSDIGHPPETIARHMIMAALLARENENAD